jgi:hypothetical protein
MADRPPRAQLPRSAVTQRTATRAAAMASLAEFAALEARVKALEQTRGGAAPHENGTKRKREFKSAAQLLAELEELSDVEAALVEAAIEKLRGGLTRCEQDKDGWVRVADRLKQRIADRLAMLGYEVADFSRHNMVGETYDEHVCMRVAPQRPQSK